MGFFDIFKRENRASTLSLDAFLNNAEITKEMALQIPTFSGGIDLIANIIASTPIKLYCEHEQSTKEMLTDYRLPLLNDETGDILTSNDFWRAIVKDYYTGKGGYAYINKSRGKIKSIHYVDEQCISVLEGVDNIFKYAEFNVNGKSYNEFEFLKILRNTKNGVSGTSLIADNQNLLAVGYYSLKLESNNFKRGGVKKGFLKAQKNLSENELNILRAAFTKLYSEDTDNFVVLNNSMEFEESSATQVEMQLNQSKLANASEFAKLFHMSPDVIAGKSSDIKSFAKLAAIPLMNTIQSALNATLLKENEKGTYYFAFDTKELLKGEMTERFSAYKTALDANFMQIDEVRFLEDLEPLGLTWIKLGLQDVLYDPATKTVYTPNTDKTSSMDSNVLNLGNNSGILEERARKYNRRKNGRFAFSTPINLSHGEKERVSHQIATDSPNLKPSRKKIDYENRNHFYLFSVNSFSNYDFYYKTKLDGNEKKINIIKELVKELNDE